MNIKFNEDVNSGWVTIFRAGDYNATGQGDWSVSKLNQVVNNYNPAFSEAPLVIGHPATNHPAFGWVEKLRVIGNELQAKFRNVTQEFKDLWNARRFNKISVSFNPNLEGRGPYLRHVGALGATLPQVKGLPAAAFAEDKAATSFTFGIDYPDSQTARGTTSNDKEFAEKAKRWWNNPESDYYRRAGFTLDTVMRDIPAAICIFSEAAPAVSQPGATTQNNKENNMQKENKIQDFANETDPYIRAAMAARGQNERERLRAEGLYELNRKNFEAAGVSKEDFLNTPETWNAAFMHYENKPDPCAPPDPAETILKAVMQFNENPGCKSLGLKLPDVIFAALYDAGITNAPLFNEFREAQKAQKAAREKTMEFYEQNKKTFESRRVTKESYLNLCFPNNTAVSFAELPAGKQTAQALFEHHKDFFEGLGLKRQHFAGC